MAPIKSIEVSPLDWGDPVLARREMPTSYNLAVVVDDALARGERM